MPLCRSSQPAIFLWSGTAASVLVRHAKAPYDAVVMYAGAWDASYTPRDIAAVEAAWSAVERPDLIR